MASWFWGKKLTHNHFNLLKSPEDTWRAPLEKYNTKSFYRLTVCGCLSIVGVAGWRLGWFIGWCLCFKPATARQVSISAILLKNQGNLFIDVFRTKAKARSRRRFPEGRGWMDYCDVSTGERQLTACERDDKNRAYWTKVKLCKLPDSLCHHPLAPLAVAHYFPLISTHSVPVYHRCLILSLTS